MTWWDWLGTLSQGQATFLGSLVGAFVGLLALLLGALFNAHLNRKRDDRLRTEERRSAAVALRAELAGCRNILLKNSEAAKEGGFPSFTMPDFAHYLRIMPHMIPKLGLFDQETIERVAEAYRVMERHGEGLFLLGGRLDERVPDKRLVSLPADMAPHVIAMNSAVSEVLDNAIAQLTPPWGPSDGGGLGTRAAIADTHGKPGLPRDHQVYARPLGLNLCLRHKSRPGYQK